MTQTSVSPLLRRHRRRGVALCTLAGLLAMPSVPDAAPAPAPPAAPVDEARNVLTLAAGTQQTLAVPRGVERLALADDTVASVLVTRKRPDGPGAMLVVTGRAAGSTTLMVWEKGSASARTYRLDVRRREAAVTGATDGLVAHAQAVDAAQGASPKDAPLVDSSVVRIRSQTVQVEVKIVEFSRSVLKEVGFQLSPYGPNNHGFSFTSVTPGALADAFNLALGFGNANQGRGLTLTLNLLQSNGLARVLAEPTLVALSGQSASFLAGGELPIPVPQGLGTTTIQYKSFGIGLSVTPTVLADDRIALKVAPEASDLDYTNAISIDGVAVPAISTRRADTTVELGDGESFVIGGLVSRTTVAQVDKVPLLGDLPIIGNFFKSQTFNRNEKELVIMVTPHLVKPIKAGVDLTAQLPGAAEQADPAVWRAMFFGGASPDALPGFSR